MNFSSFYIYFRFESNYSLCRTYYYHGLISMGLEIVACHALVTPRYEFMDHNFMGRYRILVVFKRHYHIHLKDVINDFVIRHLNPVCEGVNR